MSLAASVTYRDALDENLQWRLEIYDNTDAIVSPYTLNLTPEGVTILRDGSSQDPYDLIQPTSIDFTFYVEDGTLETLVDIFIDSNENRFTCKLERNNKGAGWETRFLGNLIRNYDTIAIDKYPYTYSLTATDGLGYLSTVPYAPNDGLFLLNIRSVVKHIKNILTYIPNIDDYYGATDPLFELSTQWEDSSIDYVTYNNTFEAVHFPHLFFEVDGNQIEYTSCLDVLRMICEKFFFWCYQTDGIYRFEQFENRFTTAYSVDRYDKDGDYSSTSAKSFQMDASTHNYRFSGAGGVMSVIPPIKEAKVVFENTDANLTGDASWSNTSSTLTNFSSITTDANTYFAIWIRFLHLTTNNSPYVDHHYKFRTTIKVGSYYLKREMTTFKADGVHEYGDFTWETSLSYVETTVWEPAGVPFVDLWDGNHFNLDAFESPVIPANGDLEVQVELADILDADGNSYTLTGGRVATWTVQLGTFIRSFANKDNTIEFVASNGGDNDKLVEYNTIFGDQPDSTRINRIIVSDSASTYVDSQNWYNTNGGDGPYKVEQLLVRQMVKLTSYPKRVIEGTLFHKDGDYELRHDGQLAYMTKTYCPLRIEHYKGIGEMSGEWMRLDLAKSGSPATVTFTEAEIFDYQDPHQKHIRLSADEATAQTTLSITKPGRHYPDGSTVVIVEADTQKIFRTTLSGDLSSTDTTMTVNDALTFDCAAWSMIQITPYEEANETQQYYELFSADGFGTDITPFVGGTYLDVTVGDLPVPLLSGGAIRTRCEVWRNGIKHIYTDTETKNYHFSIDISGSNNRIEFYRAINANDDIEVKFIN